MLTDTKLRKALGKRRDKVEVISDSHGLNVRLTVSGGVSFFYRYRWEEKPVQLTIGDYPSITLSQARERRQQFRLWITQGYDPRRQVVLERIQKVDAMTVSDAYTYWEEHYAKPEGLIKITKNRQNFQNHIKPVLGDMIVNHTTKTHWLNLFDGMGRRVVTGQALSLMQRAFRFCHNRGVIDINPLAELRGSDVAVKAAMKDRVLSDDEIKTIWESLDGLPSRQQIVLKFLMITGCRSTEIRTAKWEWFNYKERTWTVPGSEYKTGKTTRRALPDIAILLLKAHQETSITKHVLTRSRYKGPEDDKPPAQPNIAFFSAQIIMKTGMNKWSLHDLRRTVATRLSELGAPPHVIEKLLGHQMSGVMARYNLHDYINDQHEWLKVWTEHLEKVLGQKLM
ncbi:tyrosine-type recombinase/integrase [Pantoea dispersa]|uniref:tyrosine-type recombinase/integrase n=1 Tax=Pantoea dispersa TaxID=59814 RepID=UPI0021F726EB|nr:site-specific integrase [Pantoea dispersa]MCW0320076.1 Prophage integrase IntS [Pantoea dispersa]MCW0324812.1 Prophage integrase IntS [Pantoea dispersa]MCW0431460.1 Prophage integrase IntS [Pantoea dispersa]